MAQIALVLASLMIGIAAGWPAGLVALVGGYLAALFVNELYHHSGGKRLGRVALVTMPACALLVGGTAALALG